MSDLDEIYQEVILDHNKHPRNFGPLEGAVKAEGYNPLCGDKITIYVRIEDDVVADVHFEGAGCAISQASASVMTTLLRGKTRDEAKKIFSYFQDLATGSGDPEEHLAELGELAALAGIRNFPTRIKCATLAWHTMKMILDGKESS